MALVSTRNADRKHEALVRLRQTRFFDTDWRTRVRQAFGRPAPIQATPPPIVVSRVGGPEASQTSMTAGKMRKEMRNVLEGSQSNKC